MKKISLPPLLSLPIATDDGVFTAHYSEKGLAALNFPAGGANVPASRDGRPPGPVGRTASRAATQTTPASIGNPKSKIGNVRAWHKLTEAALKKVLSGHAPRQLPPLDWTGTTPFQQSVWRAMLQIACGETKSYGQLARAIRKPAAVRAVGGACGANPIPVLVPCHRILVAHGRLGGFSGGLAWKRRLLAREGIVL
jgi:O-6-methylguanine DNA methyltransferase